MGKIKDYLRRLFAPCVMTFQPVDAPAPAGRYSHRVQILAHLQSGRSITDSQARRMYGCANLKARICELRKAGYSIKTEFIGQRGLQGSYARYWLAEVDE